jgi:hypothetical protein
MRKIIFIISLITLFSCNEKEKHYEKPSIIKLIEHKYFGSFSVKIIEVNEIQYLINSEGGIIKLEKSEIL